MKLVPEKRHQEGGRGGCEHEKLDYPKSKRINNIATAFGCDKIDIEGEIGATHDIHRGRLTLQERERGRES